MKHKILSIALLTAMLFGGAGQTWAEIFPDLGKIVYTQSASDHGSLAFFADEACQTAIQYPGNGLYSEDLTDNTVYIQASPAAGYKLGAADAATGKVSFIQAEVTVGSHVASARNRGTAVTVGVGDFVDVVATATPGVYSLVMPDDANLNLRITADFPAMSYVTEVSYIDPTKSGVAQYAKTPAGVPVYVLDGTETVLGSPGTDMDHINEVWYVCQTPASANSGKGLLYDAAGGSYSMLTIAEYCHVHLILADDCLMTVIGEEDISYGIDGSNSYGSLTIYGQQHPDATYQSAEGALSINTQDCAICTCNLTINGGQINASCTDVVALLAYYCLTINGGHVRASSNGDNAIAANTISLSITGGTVEATCTGVGAIYSGGPLTISGATVTANGGDVGLFAVNSITISGGKVTATGTDNGIFSYTGAVDILGGQLEASSIFARGLGRDGNAGGVTLGWTEPDDYITAGSYGAYTGEVKIADGQRFAACNIGGDAGLTASAIVSGSSLDSNPVSFTLDDIAGKTLRPIDGFLVSAPADLSFVGTDQAFSITTGEGDDAVTTNYAVYKASTQDAPVSATVEYVGTGFAQLSALPEITDFAAVTDQPMQRSFDVPAQDVTLGTTVLSGFAVSGGYTYNGSPQTPAVTIGDVDFAAGNYSVAFKLGDVPVSEAKNAGSYTAELIGLGQYVGTSEPLVFDIDKKPNLKVTAQNKTIAYGSEVPEFTVSYAVFVGNDNSSSLGGTLTFSCDYTSSSATGTYTITPGGLTSDNYEITFVDGLLTVEENAIEYASGTITQDETGYIVKLDEGTGSALPLPIDGEVSNLEYKRILIGPGSKPGDVSIGDKSANLYTVCLPFACITGAGVTYYTLSKVDGITLTFEEITGEPSAFTPYLVAVTDSRYFIDLDVIGGFKTTKAINSKTVNGYTFTGTLTGLKNSEALSAAGEGNGLFILQDKGKWGKVVTGDVHIPPFRAYIVGPVPAAGARILNSRFGDDATDIKFIRTTDADGTEQWYDLNGRRIAKPTTKGVYIRNGKKTTN